MSTQDTVIIIPALNEEKSIAKVLNELPKERLIKIIVIDNGSQDKTSQVAVENGAEVYFESQKGYGKACLTGIEKAKALSPKIIGFIDGDYSDHPQELSSLLSKIDEGYEMVIGSRLIGESEKGALLPVAVFGNWLSTFLMKYLFKGPTFTDLGPFRVITLKALEKIKMKDEDFGWTVEMQAKALKFHIKSTEVPVSYRKRIGKSKISGTIKGSIQAGVKILYTIFKIRFF